MPSINPQKDVQNPSFWVQYRSKGPFKKGVYPDESVLEVHLLKTQSYTSILCATEVPIDCGMRKVELLSNEDKFVLEIFDRNLNYIESSNGFFRRYSVFKSEDINGKVLTLFPPEPVLVDYVKEGEDPEETLANTFGLIEYRIEDKEDLFR